MTAPAVDHFADRAFPTLDAVRAAGALMVLLTHVGFNTGQINSGWTGAALSRLDFGVTLFFIVSGFLLARPLFRTRVLGRAEPSVLHYLWKRALRILPLYWTVVVIAMLVDPLNDDATLADWVSHLTLTQIYRDAPLASSLTQMWSLCTEVAFYLVLPFLVRALSGRGFQLRRIIVGSAVLTVLGLAWAALAAPVIGPQAGQWLPAYLPWFLIGVVLAACSAHPDTAARLDRAAGDLVGWWILGVATFAVACSDLAGPRLLVAPTAWEGFLKCALYAVAGGCLMFPLLFGPERGGRIRHYLASPIPEALGKVSFGVFSIHMLVLIQGMRLLGIQDFTGHFGLVLLVTAVISGLAAAVSYRLLELPFLRLKNRWVFTGRDPATTATASTDKA